MALFKEKLNVADRVTHETFEQFIPLEPLCHGIVCAGKNFGLDVSAQVEDVKVEGVDRPAVVVRGVVKPGNVKVDYYFVQSNLGTTHFVTTYWKGLKTFKQNFGMAVFQGDGLFGDMVRERLRNQKDAKFARAYAFIDILQNNVIPAGVAYALQDTPAEALQGSPDKGGSGGYELPVKTTDNQERARRIAEQERLRREQEEKRRREQEEARRRAEGERCRREGETDHTKRDTVLNKLVTLTREEASNGCRKAIRLSDGRTVTVSIPAGVESDTHVDVAEQGRINTETGKRGVLRLSFQVLG